MMNNFKKYTSIENTYRKKYIDRYDQRLSGWRENTSFIVHEKLDGANIQLIIDHNGLQKVGKRTSFLNEGEPFFDIWNTLKKYDKEIAALTKYSKEYGSPLRIFGEIYGPGINGRIDYGSEKKVAIFDMYWDDIEEGGEYLFSQQRLERICRDIGIEHLLCPTIGYFNTLEEALAIDVETIKLAGNYSEGIVIQPFNTTIYMNGSDSERFILKKKSARFEDKQDKSDDQKALPKEKDIIYDLNRVFRGYITKNRIIDTFAKYGQIAEPKQIGEYINFILDDAKVDFLKDNDIKTLIPDMERKREKDLYNVGPLIVDILKEYL